MVELLARGPRWYGYATNTWTMERMAEVVNYAWGTTWSTQKIYNALYHGGVPWRNQFLLEDYAAKQPPIGTGT